MTTAHIDLDLATSTVEAFTPVFGVDVEVGMPSVTFGVPGPQGATGATGLVKVTHGADPDVARPDAPLVYWVGSVHPTHADPDDLLLLKGT